MSEPDDKSELSKRPWDPAGTQPKHDPDSLLPESSEPLLPPDAEVVESDAIDEEHDGDLLPERHHAAGAPAVAAAGPSEYAPRFQFMTGALVAVGIAALVGVTIAIVGIAPKSEGPAWSSWKPSTGGLQGATEIASHIAGAYRDQGRQLVKVDANDISYKGIPLLVAMRKSAEEGGAIQVHDEKGVLYQMCGLGVNCQIDSGKPSKERMLLLRREGLELALYSFRYLKDVTLSPDATLVDQTTNPYLFSLMGSSFNDRGYLVLDPYSPSADKALQKRLKDQQKQAAAAAAQAAAGSTPQSSGG